MKLEICSRTMTVLIVAVCSLLVAFLFEVGMRLYNERLAAAFAAGYEESTLHGTGSIAWTKAGQPPAR